MSQGGRGLPIHINRKAPPPKLLPFTEYFKGFEDVQAVRKVFGSQTDAVLGGLKVSFMSPGFMYMGIRDEDGSINVGAYHLKHSDVRTLYLDVVHELFHIRQWRKDKKSFGVEHRKFMGDWSLYWSSPIEVPAYRHTVREAERIGMSRKEIVEHLKMGPAPPKAFARFLKEMAIRPGSRPPRPVRLPVKINRKAPVPLFPFTDYFKGFEKIAAVRKLFGDKTEEFLESLRVEFVHASFIEMIPSDLDGHLIVGTPYLKRASPTSIYLDALACLNISKRASEAPDSSRKIQRGIEYGPVLVESYKAMLEEAGRLHVPRAKVVEHLELPRFMMEPADYKKFLRKLNLDNRGKKRS